MRYRTGATWVFCGVLLVSPRGDVVPIPARPDVETILRELLQRNGIVCSMSRRANCWDNAVAESFFSTLKTELIDGRIYRSREQAVLAVFEYIECFYNRKRLHSSIGYCSPADFEARMGAV